MRVPHPHAVARHRHRWVLMRPWTPCTRIPATGPLPLSTSAVFRSIAPRHQRGLRPPQDHPGRLIFFPFSSLFPLLFFPFFSFSFFISFLFFLLFFFPPFFFFFFPPFFHPTFCPPESGTPSEVGRKGSSASSLCPSPGPPQLSHGSISSRWFPAEFGQPTAFLTAAPPE